MHWTFPLGVPSEYTVPFGMKKLEWYGYPKAKTFEDMFSRFDRILACDRQTDRRADGQTSCDSIVRAMHSIAR